LWLTGQTVNIMTLGGLALAIGVLVDESTVAVENIHSHLARGEPVGVAVFEATRETITPRLLAMLAILAVFVPSFFLVGVSKSLFVPLSLAVGFAMLASYLLSNTLVPVLSVWLLRHQHVHDDESFFNRAQRRYEGLLGRVMRLRWAVFGVYLLMAGSVIFLIGRHLGNDIFPNVDTGMFQLRLRAPAGTRVERTEVIAQKALDVIRAEAGADNVAITLGYVGTQPASFPVNTIHLWTSGPQEAALLISLRHGSGVRVEEFEERLRRKLPEAIPGVALSFEAGDVVSQVLNFGAPTPIEIAVSGPNLAANRAFADKVIAEMKKVGSLRDLQFSQPLDYPTVNINIDRERAGQLGVTVEQIGRSLAAATSSSRFIQPNYWRDPASGVAYQVQVEIPQSRMNSVEEIENIPVTPGGGHGPYIRDVAQVGLGTAPGQYDRYNQQRMITITSNISGQDLGGAAREVSEAIRRAGEAPRGVTVNVRGQVPPMQQTLSGLQTGLLLAVVVILLLLTAYFQSLRIALVVLAAIPAVVAGVALALWLTRTTLNVQSFMGAIMAIGVSVANAILLVAFAETQRQEGLDSFKAAIAGATSRLRPILMTSFAMIAGMLPMALAFGEGGEQTAPLGRAVIGGLVASTIAVLTVLPPVFAVVQRRAGASSPSIHPYDTQKTDEQSHNGIEALPVNEGV
jgi:multidrug efflux pump subunit AcrB